MKSTLRKFLPAAILAMAASTASATDAQWTAAPLTASSASIRTDGTLKYAYARGDYTVNGVAFVGVGNSIVSNANCVVWNASSGALGAGSTATGIDQSEGDYKKLLEHCWWANPKNEGRKIALNNLENGKQYLVQIIAFRDTYTTQTAIAPDGETTIRFGGTGWEYGGSLTGVFTASGTSEEFTFQYSAECCINGIQVRELGVTVATESDPSIGSVSARRKGTAATVTLSGVAMGTDENRHPATSYSVAYRLDGGAWTPVLSDQNGEIASFVIEGLDYRDYPCEVRIMTDAGKSADGSVTLAFAKADGLAIVFFDVESAALAFGMGTEGDMAAKLPIDAPIYCTLVTSTNLADVVWAPAEASREWKENHYPAGDDRGWTWCVGLDTDAPVRFFRIAVTPVKLAEDDEVVFR